MSELTQHGPYLALKRGDGRITDGHTAEIYVLAKGLGPYARASAERDGLTPVPVMIHEIPHDDALCQKVMERSLERAREAQKTRWWPDLLGAAIVIPATVYSILHSAAGWAAFGGFYIGISLCVLAERARRLADALSSAQH